MKRNLSYIILLVSVLQIQNFEAGAQATGDSRLPDATLYREKLQLFTDRDLYASGEKLSFRLHNLSHPLLKENQWSRVFYLELINSRNAAVARGKYQLHSWGGEGQVSIPDTVSTGPYYLRAYTRWMRNYPASEFFHLPLAIVNPRKISSADLFAEGGGQGPGISEKAPGPKAGIVISSDKSSYGKREKVSVEINPESLNFSPDGYCISVIKKGYLEEVYPFTSIPGSEDPHPLKDIVFYPETRGATVSGTLQVGEDSKPADGYLLGLTVMGSNPDYMEIRTDEDGRFRIPVQQHRGNKDALLSIHSNRDETVRIHMDDAYSSEFSTVPIPVRDLSGERKALVEEAMVNAQLRAAFELPDREGVHAAESDPEFPFYGTPEFKYRMEDYVSLPDLEEFFFEIVPQVQVVINEDQSDLLVLDEGGKLLYTPPLILLDHVPVTDIGKLLTVSPLRIDFIDVVNRIYVRGGNTYGGIVSIHTAQGDRAGIALPDGSSLIKFTGLTDLEERLSPDYEATERKARMPDLRNTLYWEARFDIAPNKGANFEFYTSDQTGEFMVVVRGISSEGKVLTGTCEFMVK